MGKGVGQGHGIVCGWGQHSRRVGAEGGSGPQTHLPDGAPPPRVRGLQPNRTMETVRFSSQTGTGGGTTPVSRKSPFAATTFSVTELPVLTPAHAAC